MQSIRKTKKGAIGEPHRVVHSEALQLDPVEIDHTPGGRVQKMARGEVSNSWGSTVDNLLL